MFTTSQNLDENTIVYTTQAICTVGCCLENTVFCVATAFIITKLFTLRHMGEHVLVVEFLYFLQTQTTSPNKFVRIGDIKLA